MMRIRVVCALLLSFLALASTIAQKTPAQLRTVTGTVVDKDDNPVADAVVYLENRKTKVIRTLLSSERGLYTFSGLDPNVDYDIHAELNGLTSITKTISSFDSRKDIVVTLKLDRKKSDK
jgi:hypothetical protein